MYRYVYLRSLFSLLLAYVVVCPFLAISACLVPTTLSTVATTAVATTIVVALPLSQYSTLPQL